METQSTNPLTWLVETKFHPPLLCKDVIPRQRLLDDLHNAVNSHPLTLISAPAGYGKTTLLAGWTESQDLNSTSLKDHSELDNLQPSNFKISTPFAWLSLDEEDNDPVRYLTALLAALRRLDPACGTTAQTLLTDRATPQVEPWRVVSVLINEVLEIIPSSFALILDDLHLVTEPAIYVALDYLLEHAPPQMHLVIATRVDPPLALARLRARGQMAELRLAELRFTDEESMTFLNDRFSLDLTQEELDSLQSHTGGWVVGLRLLAGSLSRLSVGVERQAFIEDLVQSDRYIYDFLAEEVLNQQPPEVRAFLLKTAILSELTPALCQAVTGREDAGSILDQIYRRNLFVLETDIPFRRDPTAESNRGFSSHEAVRSYVATHPNYRYHDLFVEFLRDKLNQEMPELLPELHLRAAQVEGDPVRSVRHYLAAAKWDEAAEIIEQVGAEMFNRGYLDTLSRWINALPASVRESRPRLLHYLSNIVFLKGAWEEVQTLLERALRGFQAAGDESGQGEVLADLGTCAVGQGDLKVGSALYGQALEYPIPSHTRAQALLGRALAQGAWGNWAQTERDFNAAMTLVQQRGGVGSLHLVMLPFFHPEFAFLPGGLEHLERINRQAKVQVGDEVSPSRLMVDEMTTVLYLFRGRLGEAIRIGESALSLRAKLGGHPYSSLDAALFLIIAHAARGDYAAVEPLFDLQFLGVDQEDQPTPDLPIYLFYAGRVRWLQGRLQEAREIYNRMCALIGEDPQGVFPEVRICLAWMRSLLEIADERYTEAEQTLRQPEVLEQSDRGSTVHGSTRLMLARLNLQQGRRKQALVELAPVLAYHKKLGIPFTLLLEGQSIVPLLRLAVEQGLQENYASYLLELLGADDQPRPVQVTRTGQTLTPRQVEILRLVMAGHDNRTISEQLFLSEWTVKSHLTKIYRKLDVTSRTQAIALARQLGLG
jgi:ATP/maltotriose-dependent transcriptional regulator MalT